MVTSYITTSSNTPLGLFPEPVLSRPPCQVKAGRQGLCHQHTYHGPNLGGAGHQRSQPSRQTEPQHDPGSRQPQCPARAQPVPALHE